VCLCTTFILINIGFWSFSRPRKRNTSLTEPLYIIIPCQPAIKQAKKTLKELRRKDDAFALVVREGMAYGSSEPCRNNFSERER